MLDLGLQSGMARLASHVESHFLKGSRSCGPDSVAVQHYQNASCSSYRELGSGIVMSRLRLRSVFHEQSLSLEE